VPTRAGSNGQSLPGLGLKLVRYNVGGSGNNTINTDTGSVSMKKSPNMPPFKTLISFWLDWFNADPSSSSWDWSLDLNQRTMLQKSVSRGVNFVEFFSNSPPWWMDDNHATAGSDNAGDNLQNWNYEQFTVYLATVAAQARDKWGIHVTSVEPFNEPIANWWKFPGSQEGCHFDRATQNTVLPLLRAELDKLGLSETGVAASDENSIDEALTTWNSLGNKNAVARVNVHGYSGLSPYRGPNRGPLYRAVSSAKKDLWMSEYGESDGSGISMAVSISLDFSDLHPTGWVYWQAFDSGGWGLIQSNPGDNWVGTANVKYFVFAQYTRHVRSGMEIVDSGDKSTVAAYDKNGKKLVLVTVNDSGNSVAITYDLSQFSTVPPSSTVIPRWKTDTSSSGDLYKKYSDTILQQNKSFKVTFPPHCVQTFEVTGIST